MFGLLIAANMVAWMWAWGAFQDRPTLLGTALLAWVFGLRHAADADHIAAIDNVVRKLMQGGQRPYSVGLWFALGHSTVVVLASVAIAATATATQDDWAGIRAFGSVAGTLTSSFFLLTIAAANLAILRRVWRDLRHVRAGGQLDEAVFNRLMAGRGLLTRLFRPLFRAISSSWHMYPLGVLFGLGFDTATEIGLLGISATQASQGMSQWQILVFPALFTAGMTLVDTLDSVLVVRAYGWAFVDPLRKLWYNLTITAASVLVAVLVGGIEALGLLGDRLPLTGSFWDAIGFLNGNSGYVGFGVIFIFASCWLAASIAYRRQHGAAR